MTTNEHDYFTEVVRDAVKARTVPAHYRRPDLIPADEMAEAETAFRAVSETDNEYEWRMYNYKHWRIGWAWQVRMYQPHFVMSHAEALHKAQTMCRHDYESVPYTAHDNHILGTYDRGVMKTCRKCGDRTYERHAYKNYSGD